ncbi:DNA-directed DNA polymerase alpha catalytic subunit pol1 [Coemansia sp. S146]|nr:DNA-directed DNA polymerase alpha catalytic subunit pol1 [Coemansia sp. S146]
MVVIAPHSRRLGTRSGSRQTPRTAWQISMAESRDVLQRAEDDVLRRIAQFDTSTLASNTPDAPATSGSWRYLSGSPGKLWTRSNAILVTRMVMALVRYPQHSATMYAQFAGVRPPWSVGLYGALWRHMPVGILYQGFGGYHLGVVGLVVNTITPGEVSSLWAMLASVLMHYLVFALFYGTFRQSLVTRLLDISGTSVSIPQLIAPAMWWVRDRLLLRNPRGSVFCVYVRDVIGNVLQGGLDVFLNRLLTSPRSVAMYLSVAKIGSITRRLAASVLHGIGLPAFIAQSPYILSDFTIPSSRSLPAHSTRRRALMRATAVAAANNTAVAINGNMEDVPTLDMHPPAATVPMSPAEPTSSDVEIVFTGIESQLDLDDQSPPTVTRRRRSLSAGSDKNIAEKGEFLIYTQTVSAIVSSIAIRALLYPVDALIVRLMADQADGLTRFGYTGFFNCLGRIRRSPTQGDDDDDDDDDEMYMKVDEDEYQRRIHQNSSAMNDFVVDDDGAGYVEDGLDDIGGSPSKPTKPSKKAAGKAPIPVVKESRRISTMFKNVQLKPTSVKKTSTQDEDVFISSLMNELDIPLTPSKPVKRRHVAATPDTTYSARRRAAAAMGKSVVSSTPRPQPVPVMDISDPSEDPFALRPTKRVRHDAEDPFLEADSEVAAVKQEPVAESHDGVDHYIDDAVLTLDGLDELEGAKGEALYAEEGESRGQSWMEVQNAMASHAPATQASAAAASATEEAPAGDLRMYWTDAMEKSGNVYLFGKMASGASYQSCCVQVSRLERNVFLLPRIDPATGERYDALDVHRDFEQLALRRGIRGFACKPVERKYAFEVADVPASAEYLKVVYEFDQPALPADVSSTTFERAFGTTYSALELFLLKRRIMGPCWLEVRGVRAVEPRDRLSWCRAEYLVDDAKRVGVLSDGAIAEGRVARTPALTSMTLSLKTVMNHKDNANEVVAVSVLVHRDMSLDDATPAAQRQGEQTTVVRQLAGVPLPPDFTRAAQATRGMTVEVVKTEAALLNLLMALLQRTDPDILVAHNFYGFDLSVLLHRMRALRVDGWSKLGRMRRTQWPRPQASGDSSWAERQILAGRVVCDTYLASKDLIRAKSYSLSSLATQELLIHREEIPFERIPEHFAASKPLLHFVRHTAFDAFLATALMIHLQALPLTKQLTNLAGNLWARTLMGARAERNEHLLLHEFYRNKFIRPDRFFGSSKPAESNRPAVASLSAEMAEAIDLQDADDDEPAAPEAGSKPGKRKPAYLGGLVLEPKRGFYDRFVLLLDFNSLYPSIIQEYNICFTTVRRTSDALPDTPAPDLAPGILPRLLKTLVDRRRQVKQLLKRPTSPEEAGQLDLRQRALKLTANSMYGCLGFTHSRFYAKPLAMLITARGREILQATRDLALSDGLEVIYGDTDSIMIATRADALADVYEMGAQFKRRVNDRYRLLELDIDGVFKRLLLLKKKKYAALLITNPEKHLDGSEYATQLESKGLDLVRRDWCGLSHDVSDYVLKQLFADHASSDDDDENSVMTRVHEHLAKVALAVRQGKVPLDKYTVHKGLTKPPENYPDKKSQPHVLVALRLRERGEPVRSGDTVPYIICDSKCTQDAGSYAERARHPDEILASQGALYPDYDWYLNQQVLPPCARLLEPLATDMAVLAQCLGLDPSKYRAPTAAPTDDALRTLDSQIPDTERFKLAQQFTPLCSQCKTTYVCDGIARSRDGAVDSGLACMHCGHLPSPASLATQLALQIRRHIREYYAFAAQCDEPACALKSRVLPVSGSRCLRPQCSGRMQEIYSDKQLYHQIQYFAAILAVDRSATRLETTSAQILTLRDRHSEHIMRLSSVVDNYLSVSARKFVNLSSLFSFCHN